MIATEPEILRASIQCSEKALSPIISKEVQDMATDPIQLPMLSLDQEDQKDRTSTDLKVFQETGCQVEEKHSPLIELIESAAQCTPRDQIAKSTSQNDQKHFSPPHVIKPVKETNFHDQADQKQELCEPLEPKQIEEFEGSKSLKQAAGKIIDPEPN